MRGTTIRVLGLCCFGIAIAQSPPRQTHLVRVLDAAGAPVANAEVTLVAGETCPGLGDDDLVRGTTGPDGRVRLDTLTHRLHLAWAARSGPSGPFVTDTELLHGPETQLRFHGEPTPAATTLRILGTERWADEAPLRCAFVAAGSRSLVPSCAVPAGGLVPIPPLPPMLAEVRVFCGGGCVFAAGVPLGGELQLPPPHWETVVAEDAAGRPVAGVQVSWLWHFSPAPIGPFGSPRTGERMPGPVTGADGTARWLVAREADLPARKAWTREYAIASKVGCRDCVAIDSERGTPSGGERDRTAEPSSTRFLMLPEAPRQFAFRAPPGRMPAEVRWFGQFARTFAIGTAFFPEDDGATPVDANGTWRLPTSSHDASLLSVVLRWPPTAAAVGGQPRSWSPPLVVLGERIGVRQPFELGAVRELRLQLLDAAAGPAQDAAVLCVPIAEAGGWFDFHFAARGAADRAGRFVFPVLPGKYLVCACHGLQVTRGELVTVTDDTSLVVPMQAMDRCKVRVVDGDGQPIAGAGFRYRGVGWSTRNQREGALRGLFADGVAQWQLARVRTGADGTAELPFVDARGLHIAFSAVVGARESASQTLQVDPSPLEVVVK